MFKEERSAAELASPVIVNFIFIDDGDKLFLAGCDIRNITTDSNCWLIVPLVGIPKIKALLLGSQDTFGFVTPYLTCVPMEQR